MVEGLLESALAFFPEFNPKRKVLSPSMRDRFKNFRMFVQGLDDSARHALWDAAQECLQHIDLRTSQSVSLWGFSHPCYYVFEQFIADEDLCVSFADYLEVIFMSHNGRGNFRPRYVSVRHQIKSERTSAHLLAVRYAALLHRYGRGLYAYFHARKRSRLHTITLFPEVEVPVETIHSYCEGLQKQIKWKEIERITRLFSISSEAIDLANVVGMEYQYPLALRPTLNGLTDIITTFEASDFFPNIPQSWQSIAQVEAVIHHAVREGVWPRFKVEMSIVTTLNPNRVKYSYTLNTAMLDRIRDTHTSDTLDLLRRMRCVKHGLLPVGLKIHCMRPDAPGALFLRNGNFKVHNAGACFNLPPVGSTQALGELLGLIHKRTGVSYLGNPDFQIQVCSPGRLSPKSAALLGIGFYLGSDCLRRYSESDFTTTHPRETGNRLIIYGAGVLDRNFDWWERDNGGLRLGIFSEYDRTDVLTCQSMKDIENVNLIATLLLHSESARGFWHELGKEFVKEMEEMLRAHHLSGLLRASWVKILAGGKAGNIDRDFIESLGELTNYAFDEVARIRHAAQQGDMSGYRGILFEMRDMLERFRIEIVFLSTQEANA